MVRPLMPLINEFKIWKISILIFVEINIQKKKIYIYIICMYICISIYHVLLTP